MDQDFEYAYKSAKDDRKKSKIEINKTGCRDVRKSTFAFIKKLFLSKPYNENLVKKLSRGELSVAQLKQINRAIKSGLSDKQLYSIINSKKDASKMAAIIDIAISVNKREVKV